MQGLMPLEERIPQSPPQIRRTDNPVTLLWSVMIPSYNCYGYLRKALECVLAQDPGAGQMQIEVVDDASTDGDIAELVQAIGQGRVQLFRQENNVGSLRNFETCLNRSKGQFIHLLHGDDLVKPGFYQEMGNLLQEYPQAGAAFCKNDYIDHSGNKTGVTGTILTQAGLIPDWLEQIAKVNLCQTPAVVVRRSVYETLGGFYGGHYGEDWEMWCRIAANYAVAYSPKNLASYRSHDENISSRAHESGQSLRDISHFIEIIGTYLPPEKRPAIIREAKQNYSRNFSNLAYSNFLLDRKKNFTMAWNAFRFNQNKRTFINLVKMMLVYFTAPKQVPLTK